MTPALITLGLSVAALGSYVAYRFARQAPPAEAAAEQAANDTHGLVTQLPDFTLPNLDGRPQSIKSLSGKPMLINFWATWCGPCRREIPLLKNLQKQNPWLTVVGIATLDHPDAVQKYAKDIKFNYPVLVDKPDSMDAATRFGVEVFALPFTVFADSGGRVLGVHTGELHPEQIENVLAVFKGLEQQSLDVDAARKRIAAKM
ncbi:MAG TPA: TlpA disulfide reductase family protein [Gammaproteobacteria bacterium]|nr:TlpA disulfide reductase family protein [Gammaproteobacteria bacterium]